MAEAQTNPCNIPGTRPATASDAAVKNGTIEAGRCYNPNEVGIGQNGEEAKAYLNSLPKRCVGQCAAPPDKAHVDKLNDTFAICAANFFKAYTARYGTVYITSAYRDGPSGENARAGGVPGSSHTRAIAIDVNPASENLYPMMWNFAKANPQFGICFPHEGFDRPHMILAGSGGGEAAKCAARGVARPCNGLSFDPSSVQPAYGGLSPTSALSNQIRQALMTPPPPPPPQMQQPVSSSQQQPTQSAYQETPTGSGSTPTSQTPGSNLFTPVNIGTNGNTNLNNQPSPTSSIDLINALANPISATSSEIGTPIAISLILETIKDIAGLGTTTRPTTATSTASGTIVSMQPVNSQPTFTSPDLAGSVPQYSAQQLSTFQRALNDIREALARIASLLKPFRGFGDNPHAE